jgi:subtilase-type serine protease
MRVKSKRGGSTGGCEPRTSSNRRSGAIARRSAILLSGTAAIAIAASPARSVVINDLVAQQIDSGNVYSNVVSLRVLNDGSNDSGCTGSLIDSRTILTAAHCLYDQKTGQPITNLRGVSFRFDAAGDLGNAVSSFKGHLVFRNDTKSLGDWPVTRDIAVISLAQPVPVTNVAAVKLLMLQPEQAGFPAKGTTITMVGYGAYGTGSNPPIFWFPKQEGTPPPQMLNNPPQRPAQGGDEFARS